MIPWNRNSRRGLLLSGLVLLTLHSWADDAATVTGLGFQYKSGRSQLTLSFDRPVEFQKSLSEADNQVIIDVPNAKIPEKWARRIDASQHPSNVALISPYQQENSVRVVLQLKGPGDVELSQDGTGVVAFVENGSAEQAMPPTEALTQTELAPSQEDGIVPAVEQKPVNPNDPLEVFVEAQKSKNFVGKKISLQLKEAELGDVFQVISEASEFNIVVSDSVKGKVILNLSDVPWDQALDIILQSYKLAAERRGNVLRVTTLDELTKEKEAIVLAKKASEAAEPIVVKIFPISYAKVDDLKKILEDFLSGSENGPTSAYGRAGAGGRRGSIQVDNRTNSLIVRDTPTSIERVARLIKELDTQTPQVLIEAKFVEVDENDRKSISGRLLLSSREYDSSGNLAFGTSGNQWGGFFGGNPLTAPASFAITPPLEGGAGFGFSPRAGLIPGIKEIGAFLNILESESRVKIIASPRVVTLNKEPADLSQGQTVQLLAPGSGDSAGTFQTVNLVLRLTVTPQITNEGSIAMKLSFAQDSQSNNPVAGASLTTDTKKIETSVLVDSGGTLVIGGIYKNEYRESESGIPLLRDLPIIGALFGSKDKQMKKNELFIFLSPRIINEKEAAIGG